ncbi:MAG: hypothetical protein D5R98_04775 [Desulfonatronovibrio sp. MSAO_Bac4]|nr:MAG: hypothetical protein D5R98_04775 [Desulfonatronovibrio sp. MSAO_Bac4]
MSNSCNEIFTASARKPIFFETAQGHLLVYYVVFGYQIACFCAISCHFFQRNNKLLMVIR